MAHTHTLRVLVQRTTGRCVLSIIAVRDDTTVKPLLFCLTHITCLSETHCCKTTSACGMTTPVMPQVAQHTHTEHSCLSDHCHLWQRSRPSPSGCVAGESASCASSPHAKIFGCSRSCISTCWAASQVSDYCTQSHQSMRTTCNIAVSIAVLGSVQLTS
jgi:hypothetical protein